MALFLSELFFLLSYFQKGSWTVLFHLFLWRWRSLRSDGWLPSLQIRCGKQDVKDQRACLLVMSALLKHLETTTMWTVCEIRGRFWAHIHGLREYIAALAFIASQSVCVCFFLTKEKGGGSLLKPKTWDWEFIHEFWKSVSSLLAHHCRLSHAGAEPYHEHIWEYHLSVLFGGKG